MKNKLIKQFYQINQDLYQKAKNPLKCHGPDHHLRVCNNALMLNRKLKLNADLEILIPACFFHDITAFYPEKTEIHHRDHHSDLTDARKILRKLNYPIKKTDKILNAICAHGSNPKYIKKNEPIEITLLRDADKMDVFGPLGVARIIMPMTRRGYDLQRIADEFYNEGHLKQKYDAIKIKEAKKLVKKDYQYSLNFFKELDRKLKS